MFIIPGIIAAVGALYVAGIVVYTIASWYFEI